MLVNSNLGAFYMFSLACSYYAYALVMWYIFFMVPSRFGQVSRLDVEQLGIVGRESELLHLNDEENLKTVVRELEHDRRFTRMQIRQGRAGSEDRLSHGSTSK